MHFSFSGPVFGAALLTAGAAELACAGRAAALVGRWGCPTSVCLGTLAGTALTLIPLWIWGAQAHRFLPETPLRIGAALFFLGTGLQMLFGHPH